MKPRSYIKPISEKQKGKLTELEKLNWKIWMRDGCACVLCNSRNIYGKPFCSGSHHILSRGIAPAEYLSEQNLVLLCINCHSPEADTVPARRKLIQLMAKLHPEYDYTKPPYQFYLEEETVQV